MKSLVGCGIAEIISLLSPLSASSGSFYDAFDARWSSLAFLGAETGRQTFDHLPQLKNFSYIIFVLGLYDRAPMRLHIHESFPCQSR